MRDGGTWGCQFIPPKAVWLSGSPDFSQTSEPRRSKAAGGSRCPDVRADNVGERVPRQHPD